MEVISKEASFRDPQERTANLQGVAKYIQEQSATAQPLITLVMTSESLRDQPQEKEGKSRSWFRLGQNMFL
jgi:hypothetical protein